MRWYILLKSFLPSLGADEEAKDAVKASCCSFLKRTVEQLGSVPLHVAAPELGWVVEDS